jgi:hypothetical protein
VLEPLEEPALRAAGAVARLQSLAAPEPHGHGADLGELFAGRKEPGNELQTVAQPDFTKPHFYIEDISASITSL